MEDHSTEKNKWGSLVIILMFVLPLVLYFLFKAVTRPVFKPFPYVYTALPTGDSIPMTLPEDFSWNGAQGTAVTPQTFQGKISVLSFFAPEDSLRNRVLNGNLERVYDNADEAGYIQLISLYTGDSAAHVFQRYIDRLEVDQDKWIHATGNPAHIEQFWKSMGLSSPDSSLYPVCLQQVALIDKEGRVRKIYMGTDLGEIKTLNEDLRAITIMEYPEELDHE